MAPNTTTKGRLVTATKKVIVAQAKQQPSLVQVHGLVTADFWAVWCEFSKRHIATD